MQYHHHREVPAVLWRWPSFSLSVAYLAEIFE